MATDTKELAAKVSDASGKLSPLAFQSKAEAWFKQNTGNLVNMAGGDTKKMNQVFSMALSVINRNPALLDCTSSSLISCMMQSMSLGLLPGPFKECAYVPLRNGRTGQREANFWPQYEGLVKLMINAGNKVVIARVVREGDMFHFFEGDKPPTFVPAAVLGHEPGKRLFAYCAICTVHGAWHVQVMSPAQIETVKSRSPGSKMSDSPWNSKYDDDVDAMWAKCPLKRAAKFVSKSPELLQAIALDDHIDADTLSAPILPLASDPLVVVEDNDAVSKSDSGAVS